MKVLIDELFSIFYGYVVGFYIFRLIVIFYSDLSIDIVLDFIFLDSTKK